MSFVHRRSALGALLLSTQFAVVLAPANALNEPSPQDISPRSEQQITDPISQLPPPPQEPTPAKIVSSDITPVTKNQPVAPLQKPIIVKRDAAVQRTTAAQPSSGPLRDIVRRKNLALPLRNARIVVWKAQRRLELRDGDQIVKVYRVALGTQPVGHKERLGDGRTPEGQYFICTRNASTSAFHIFLGLSYPALPDATRGVNNKAITQREYQIIRQRLASRSAPLWRTRLGGWVGIHGGSDASFAQRKRRERGSNDWTAGCIALTDAEIREIYAATKLGTPVLVKP